MPLAPGDLLTVQHVLAILPIGRSTLYDLVKEGAIPSFRIRRPRSCRGRILIHHEDLETFVQKLRDAGCQK